MEMRSFIGPVRCSDNLSLTKSSAQFPGRWPELPLLTIFGGQKEEESLTAALPEFIRNVYQHAVCLLGEDEAKALFVRTVTKKRGERGPGRGLPENRDAILLQQYDRYQRVFARARLPPKTVGRIPRLVAEDLHRIRPGFFGLSPAAIEKHIRRLLRKRQKPLNSNSTTEAMCQTLLKLFGDK